MNRDYFTTPYQGSRSAHGYGRTDLSISRSKSRVGWRQTLTTMVIVFATTVFICTHL